MPETETSHISLEDLSPPASEDIADSRRQSESSRQRACVLAGSALLQLPIWGFVMCYGVFQEYYYNPANSFPFSGNRELTGVIGTTSNGVIYLSMPFLFALFTRNGGWAARRRRPAALCGSVLTCASFVLSSFSTHVWHLVATQGVLAALGCALIYSPTTLSLGEWFNRPGGSINRSVAYGVVLSCKNIVGSGCPFLIRFLLDRWGLRTTLLVWTAITAGVSVVGIMLVLTPPQLSSSSEEEETSSSDGGGSRARRHHGRHIPWQFLRHQTFYIYCVSIVCQSAGYGIPQTYLNTYAAEVTLLSQASATLMLALFNVPGIFSSSFFGYLGSGKPARSRRRWGINTSLSAAIVTAISAVSAGLSAFLLWGLTSSQQSGMALLVLFSVTFGFFAGGYSATWGGILNELEREAAQRNEAIDTGMLYGLLNGARGIGYVSGGLAGVPLLRAGSGSASNVAGVFGYETTYGPLIVFTGLSSVLGGLGLLWKWERLLRGWMARIR
ncbi:putative monocarboxylate transporter [Apodospora peruviana]|uniref:Monocarboxylate transporter n=1 Tax=Apodospora peruviana TaxID=516989 RepID=A0AAE0IQK5_9PEZI|nr:putative monocarboxylate transporter [Apodospora peruviana]